MPKREFAIDYRKDLYTGASWPTKTGNGHQNWKYGTLHLWLYDRNAN